MPEDQEPKPAADLSDTVTLLVDESPSQLISWILKADGKEGELATAEIILSSQLNRYKELGLLGRGGMGKVLLVHDRDLKREVAMKMLLSKRGDSVHEEALLRFIEEAQANGQLEHPNIVPVHDIGINREGQLYFTMKRIRGQSLKQVIRSRALDQALLNGTGTYREEYSSRRLVETLIDICQGVAFAHSRGVVHRDLKPANVMLGDFGEVLVVDWGLARVKGSRLEDGETDEQQVVTSRAEENNELSIAGEVRGTPNYMAPEQASGDIDAVDERTDVYALGALLFAILCGVSPYKGVGPDMTLVAIIRGVAPVWGRGAHGFQPIPRELKAICKKAMSSDPADRYPSADAMRADLEAYLDLKPVSALRLSPPRRIMKWALRNRSQVLTSVVTAALLSGLVAGSLVGYRAVSLHKKLEDADYQFNNSWRSYQAARSGEDNDVADDDPYRDQILAMRQGNSTRMYREQLQETTRMLQSVLDVRPRHVGAKTQLAEIYMDLWRLAMNERNVPLMDQLQKLVERYAPFPNPYKEEIEGLSRLKLTIAPNDAKTFLYRFEKLNTRTAEGRAMAPRLVPVPVDPAAPTTNEHFLVTERRRIQAGEPVPGERPSVYNLPTRDDIKLAAGRTTIENVPPGSYLLLIQAPGRAEVRVPLSVGRQETITRQFEPPPAAAVPEGFVAILGGPVILGGETAGAGARHTHVQEPFIVARLEVTMAEYAEFLQHLVDTGRRVEARARLPRDFGRILANLDPTGALHPMDPDQDLQAFLRSPVRGVSLVDAQAYIGWRSKQDGRNYKLPEDQAWEAACRGADGRTYSWGEVPGDGFAIVTQGYGDVGNDMAWAWNDAFDESPWGVHNMAGAVAEWTASLFSPGAADSDPVQGQYSIRGNAWALPPVGLECAFRTSGQPDYFHPTIGFRLALDYPR
jgi:serine/threonine protein kinase/formylglycine-generating enzyme required for sulfatase activity